MELKEFITKTLLDIISGVKEAQKETEFDTISPSIARGGNEHTPETSKIQPINFEVSIKVDEQTSGQAKLNVGINWFGAGAKGEISKSEGHDATLKFRIPVRLPVKKTEDIQG
jgi:hypothetical protein